MEIPHDVLGEILKEIVNNLDSIKACRMVCKRWESRVGTIIKDVYGDEYRDFYCRLNLFIRFIKEMEIHELFRLEYEIDLGQDLKMVVVINHERGRKWVIKVKLTRNKKHLSMDNFDDSTKKRVKQMISYSGVTEKTLEEIVSKTKVCRKTTFLDVQLVLRKLLHYNTLLCRFVSEYPEERDQTLKGIIDKRTTVSLYGIFGYASERYRKSEFGIYPIKEDTIWASHCIQNIFRKGTVPFQWLPKEIKEKIFGHLTADLGNIQTIRSVCRAWREIVDSEVYRIYYPFYERFYSNVEYLFGFMKDMEDLGDIKIDYEVNMNLGSIIFIFTWDFSKKHWRIGTQVIRKRETILNKSNREQFHKEKEVLYNRCGIKNQYDYSLCRDVAVIALQEADYVSTYDSVIYVLRKLFDENCMGTKIILERTSEGIGYHRNLHDLKKGMKILTEYYECDTSGKIYSKYVIADLSFTGQKFCHKDGNFYMPKVLMNILKRKLNEGKEEQRNS